MKVIAAIRTSAGTNQEYRTMAQVQPVVGEDRCVVFHNRKPHIVPPVPVVALTGAATEAPCTQAAATYRRVD